MNSPRPLRSFAPVLTFLVLIIAGGSLSVTPLFEKTNKYIETGTATLNTAPYYSNASSNSLEQITFTVTFAGSITSYNAVSSIQAMNYNIDASGVVNITCFVCAFYTNGVDFCLRSKSLSQLSVLKTRYLILDTAFNKITHFYSAARYYVQNYGTANYGSANPIVNNFGLPTINTASTTRIFVMLNGFNATSTSTTSYSFDISMVPMYVGSATLRVTTSSTNAATIQFSSLCYCIIGYNQNDVMAWPFPSARITFGTFNLASPFSDSNSLFESYNTFWGVKALNTTGLTTLDWSTTLNPQTSVTASTTQAGSSYSLVGMTFQFKECNPSSTPYYLISQNLCYDLCPNRYYENNAQMTCVACTNFDCLKCLSNGTCTACDNATQHRTLNTGTGRCVPVQGYYESNVAIAAQCNSNCKTCQSAPTTCYSCYPRMYLSGSTCSNCPANCLVCNNTVQCMTCDAGYTLDGSYQCGFAGYNCSAIANCLACNVTNGCTTCNSGYGLTNATKCSTICGDSIWVQGTQGCDDGNTISGDGCSSTCTVQSGYFCGGGNMSASSCSSCSNNCATCDSPTNCSSCQAPYILFTNATGDFCQVDCSPVLLCITCHLSNTSTVVCDGCFVGYSVGGSNNCVTVCGDGYVLGTEECDDGNLAAGDGCSSTCTIENTFACTIVVNTSVCTQCTGPTFQAANKTVCEPCPYDCGTCDASGNCSSCDSSTNRVLDANSSRCVPAAGFYEDGTSHLAPSCDPSCSTCTNGTSADCSTCGSTRVLNGTECPSCSVVAGAGCVSCAGSGVTFVCSACAGSTLSSGGCVFTPPDLPKPPNMMIIILAAVGGLLLCSCCLILFCCWRRRRNEENKVENEQVPQKEEGEEKQKQDDKKQVDPFDQKLLQTNKKKYRGGKINDTAPKVKRRRAAPIRQQTEENELSMEQFRGDPLFDTKKAPKVSKQSAPLIAPVLVEPIPVVQPTPNEKIPEDYQDLQMDLPSVKHEVNDGPEVVPPPQPERQQIAPSEDGSSKAQEEQSQISR